ncbi:hypothetical protein F5146DRAFT_1125743 [Armillaria mellea]|nr:hypothetical protein F5146DRAFT_1125743 [Armillaria mellea]
MEQTLYVSTTNILCSDVALKIMTDEAAQAPGLHELESLQQLCLQNPGHIGYTHVVHLADSFYIDGPKGKHLCIATEMAISNLLTLPGTCFVGNRCQTMAQNSLYGTSFRHWIGFMMIATSYIQVDIKITNVIVTVPRDTVPKEGVGTLIRTGQHTFPVSWDNDPPVSITNSTPIVPNLD